MSDAADTIPDGRLLDWGWNDEVAAGRELDASRPPARVIAQHRGEYRLITPWGEATGVAPGRMLYRASGRRELPAVGDWVLVEPQTDGPATIVEILPRRTQFVRRKAGTESQQQVVAANVDVAFLVTSLNQELSPRRIERYLVAAREGCVQPVVVLTKLDQCDDLQATLAGVLPVAAGAPVVAVSAVTGEGIELLRSHLRPGETVVLLGSSGVGKSTLVNTLAGEELLRTQEIRQGDDKGRHTTTHREIFRLPDGVLVLDTPGMREIGLVEAEEGLEETFDDVAEIVAECRFRDCTHADEPGCAVRPAVQSGAISAERWASYEKLQKEAAYDERRRDAGAALAEKRRWKQIQRDYRKNPKKGR